ncbi:MAG: hypothetical protein M1416_03300 [Candidatus Pacearchaeota archaeon]|nr:hypothetical protein [Candidatus Pacearchaeota archaeon]
MTQGILGEIEAAAKIKEENLHRFENYFLALLSMIFGLSVSFFAQIFLIKYPGMINKFFIYSLIICLFIGGLIILTIIKLMKEVERSHNWMLNTMENYAKRNY